MSIRKRVVGGAAGFSAVRFVTLAGPLLQLPVMIGRWGIDMFGGWVTASALATLCMVAALSIYPAIQANVAMNLGRGDRELAARYHTSGLAMCIASTIFLLVVVAGTYDLMVLRGIYSVPGIDLMTMNLLFLANATNGIAAYNSSVMGSVGRFGLGNAVEAARRAVELAVMLALIGLLSMGPLAIAILLCVSAAIGVAVSTILLQRVSKPILPPARFDAQVIWQCRGAILGAFCLAYAYPQLFIVGPRILIGISLGNTAVAFYAVATNLIRVLRQIADVISYPFLNDMSYSFGEGRTDRLRSIFLLPSRLCFFMSLSGGLGIVGAGPFLIYVLTRHSFLGGRELLAVMAVAAVIECTSLVAQTLLLGIGRTILPSVVLLFVGAVVMIAAIPLANKIGLMAFGLANLIGTIAYAISLWAIALSAMDLSWRDFATKLTQPPIREIFSEIRRLSTRRQ